MKENFEEFDQKLKDALSRRQPSIPPEKVMKDFEASVHQRVVRAEGRLWMLRAGLVTGILVFAAILLLFSRPLPQTITELEPETKIGLFQSPEISDETEAINEIALLRELGVWSEEDDALIGVSPEESFSELDLIFDSPKSPVVLGLAS